MDRAQRGEAADWSLDSHLLRAVANTLVAANFQRASKKPPKDAMIPAPVDRLTARLRREQAEERRQRQEAGGAPADDKGWDDLNRMFDQQGGRSADG